MSHINIDALLPVYRDGLLDDTMPFWMNCCLDEQFGGYTTIVDQDGTVIDDDKPVWVQGRFAWLLSELCLRVEKRTAWLDAAELGVRFLREHCFDDDGRMFFLVTRDGRPLRKRRYVFSETFAIAAFAAYGQATGDDQATADALALLKRVDQLVTTPGALEAKVNGDVRASKGLAVPMILLVTSQIVRRATGESYCDDLIDRCIDEIRRDFMKEQYQAVLETVAPDGQLIDHIDGRMLCPGHAIEAAWFIMVEAKHRGGDRELLHMATTILDWMWQWGWDQEYGGIIYYRDVLGKPAMEYWNDMKFWWQQNEAIIATLMAYDMTGDAKYAKWHTMVHNWAYKHHPDRDPRNGGEWFGYLARDGRVTNRAKGTGWKGPFHLPRMQLVCWKLLEAMPRG